ncbi:MAG TPA: L,D-transpeptidase [Thermoanaerobaculia bacterium]
MKRLMIVCLTVLAVACAEKASNVVDDVSAPVGKPGDVQQRERERFDARWRQLQTFRALQIARAQQAAAAAQPPQPLVFVSGKKEKFKGLDANAINNASINLPITGDVHGPSVLKAQVDLDRAHFSVGVIDGRWGRNSAITVWWWQRSHGLEPTGDVDETTFRSIAAAGGYAPAVVPHQLTADDVKGPFVDIPKDVYDQQKLDCLCYESLREKLAEEFHCTEDFLEVLNPDVKISDLTAGATINVPNVRPPLTADQHDIAKVVISIAGNSFNAFDASGNLIFHAPTTLGAGYDPSPEETVKVVKILDHPSFHYDPTLYHEVPDSMPDAHLKPGPNSPVGVVWMALSKPHYGIHGTKAPDEIGYASSHGCVRLTNWDAGEVGHRISEGVLVSFVDIVKGESKVAER